MDIQHIIKSVNVDTDGLRSAVHQLIHKSAVTFNPSHWKPEEANKLRKTILDQIVFQGTPLDWRTFPTKAETIDCIETDNGYQIEKLRLEVLPDFWIPALLYQPYLPRLHKPRPAVLSVNGHVGPLGKSIEFVQRRCINLAKRGITTLHLEWLYFGELTDPNYTHNRLAYLDLCGVSGLSVFYLAMRGGLDFLWEHPFVIKEKIAMTGLSGGGWQTIFLSALDQRITVAIPNAGYIDISNRLTHASDIGDLEQNPNDLLTVADYTHLTALLSPRPALLIYNHQDDCCFVADRAKPAIYDLVKSIYPTPNNFVFYKNISPGTHNYDEDNRKQLYHFLCKYFDLPMIQDGDLELESEVLSFEDLVVGLPDKTANFKTIANKIMHQKKLEASQLPSKLQHILRYQSTSVSQVKLTHQKGKGGQLIFDNGLLAAFCQFKPEGNTRDNDTVILIADQGFMSMVTEIENHLNMGNSVLAVELFLTGQVIPTGMSVSHTSMLLSTSGLRALGFQVAQLVSILHWYRYVYKSEELILESKGRVTGIIAQLAKQLYSGPLENNMAKDQLSSLQDLINKEIEYEQCPTLFCFDLLRYMSSKSSTG